MVEHTDVFEEDIFQEWHKLIKLYEFAIDEVYTKLKILTEELKVFYNEVPVEHIKTRVKEPRSIIRKLTRLGVEPTPENAMIHLNDIAGIRIVCSYTSDIYKIFEMLKEQNDLKLIKYKDYVESPKEGGYQSLHMIVTIPVFLSDGPVDVKVEIQIRTIAMDFWASLEHKLKYKNYDKAPKHIKDELLECAHIINDLDSRMLRIKYEIDNYHGEDE
ncbi:MAG: GTP pyrophosphokinase family protein [Vallitaleaceae bacterium]|jgi:putative GTP pyrophosphokinase|nr:GTP pyrophosphokinase family protein [Vallitaleaceae bacterium]